jgi:hypothetical protein
MAGALSFANTTRLALTQAQSFFREVTGVDDPASKGAARVLMRSIRKQLATKAAVVRRTFAGEQARNEGSAPGESPRSRTGKLRRSVGQEVVGGVRRVGPASFVGRLLEEGVDTTVTVTPNGRAFGARRREKKAARRQLTIAPRPFMAQALERALPGMEGEAVSELQKRGRTGVL